MGIKGHGSIVVASDAASGEDALVSSETMRSLYRVIDKLAPTNASVLILGETGTGKEVIASAIHQRSGRKAGVIRAVNCGALPGNLLESTLFGHERGAFTGASECRKGLFEQAHGGTLFLDEIGELDLQAQAALLRVLETRRLTRLGGHTEIEVDVRVIAATHRDLAAMARDRSFRSDLHYRINALTLRVPPLRERIGEIAPFARYFLGQCCGAENVELEVGALRLLETYSWPGNVRELRNVIEHAAVMRTGPLVCVADLPGELRESSVESAGSTATVAEVRPRSGALRDRIRSFERQLILDALVALGGNRLKVAELLEIPLRTLNYRIRALGIRASWQRAAD